MFRGKFREGHEFAASFPEDDRESWELLIQWCYTESLSSLENLPFNTVATEEATKHCCIRLKLCCLAEKYDMRLLQNLAMDSIKESLQHGSSRAKPTLEGLSKWCNDVYENAFGASPIRIFILWYFHANSQCREDDNDLDLCPEDYDTQQLYDLAIKTPDLMPGLFIVTRFSRTTIGSAQRGQ